MISDFSDLGFLSFPHGGGHENLLWASMWAALQALWGTRHEDNTEDSGMSPHYSTGQKDLAEFNNLTKT